MITGCFGALCAIREAKVIVRASLTVCARKSRSTVTRVVDIVVGTGLPVADERMAVMTILAIIIVLGAHTLGTIGPRPSIDALALPGVIARAEARARRLPITIHATGVGRSREGRRRRRRRGSGRVGLGRGSGVVVGFTLLTMVPIEIAEAITRNRAVNTQAPARARGFSQTIGTRGSIMIRRTDRTASIDIPSWFAVTARGQTVVAACGACFVRTGHTCHFTKRRVISEEIARSAYHAVRLFEIVRALTLLSGRIALTETTIHRARVSLAFGRVDTNIADTENHIERHGVVAIVNEELGGV